MKPVAVSWNCWTRPASSTLDDVFTRHPDREQRNRLTRRTADRTVGDHRDRSTKRVVGRGGVRYAAGILVQRRHGRRRTSRKGVREHLHRAGELQRAERFARTGDREMIGGRGHRETGPVVGLR